MTYIQKCLDMDGNEIIRNYEDMLHSEGYFGLHLYVDSSNNDGSMYVHFILLFSIGIFTAIAGCGIVNLSFVIISICSLKERMGLRHLERVGD